MSIRTPVRAAYPPVLGPPVQATSAVNVDAEKALMLKDMQRLEVDARLLTGLTPAQKDLFEYYKYRIETFEHERSEWIHRMDDLEGTRQEYYKLKWELTKRDEQIDELQRALSDAHVFLYEEREQVLKLAAENDELRIQEVEDRKRIQHLLALTQPVSQEVTYFRDCRPGKVSRNYTAIDRQAGTASAAAGASAASSTTTLAARPAAVGSARLGGAPTPAAAAGSKALTRPRTVGSSSVAARSLVPAYTPSSTVAAAGLTRPAGSQRGGQVVRTIYLPNESVDVLKLIVQSLRTQLDEQKCFAEQRCQALTEDRLIREAECKDRVAVARKTVAELQRDLKALMEVHTATTKDYLDLRQELQQKEKVRAPIDIASAQRYPVQTPSCVVYSQRLYFSLLPRL
jgi:coiled-coil domain-containing protein 77